jgi:hypothetical protein
MKNIRTGAGIGVGNLRHDLPVVDVAERTRRHTPLADTNPLNGEIHLDGKVERPESFDHLIDGLPRSGSPTESNLVVFRDFSPILDGMEEADLVRSAKSGDGPAKDRLLKKYHRAILKIAMKSVPDPRLKIANSPYLGDLVAAGGVGFLEALHRFNPGRNNRLFAYAKHYIEKAVRLEAKRFWNNGTTGETRIDRRIHSRPYDKPEWIAFAIKRPGVPWSPEKAAEVLAEPDTPALIAKIAASQESMEARRSRQTYSTTTGEGGYSVHYDADWSPTIKVTVAASHDMYRIYDCFDRYKLAPQLRLHEASSRTIDAMVADLEKRAELRLKAMGRREFALWLVRRSQRRRHPVDEGETPRMKAEYTIPINTASSASDSADWKDYSTRLAEIEASHPPMVWSERDKWGMYQTHDVRPKSLRVQTMNKSTKPSQVNNNDSAAVAA